jgi:hypothetical protein
MPEFGLKRTTTSPAFFQAFSYGHPWSCWDRECVLVEEYHPVAAFLLGWEKDMVAPRGKDITSGRSILNTDRKAPASY